MVAGLFHTISLDWDLSFLPQGRRAVEDLLEKSQICSMRFHTQNPFTLNHFQIV